MATVRFSIKPHWMSEGSAAKCDTRQMDIAGTMEDSPDSHVKVPREIEKRQKWKRALVDLLEVMS